MHRRLKPVLAFVLSLFMSVSTLSNTYTVFAEDEITQEETNTVDETTTDGTETDDTETEDTETEETNTVDETVDENTDTNVEEQMGDSNMMEYFLVDSPVVSSQETENFVLSLNNIEGYSNFRITIQKEDGTTLDLESSETVGNLVKFSNVFSNKGEYQVTSLHYVYNGQTYYLNFSDLEMDVKFGVDQEYVGYDETLPDLTQDSQNQEGVIQVTDVNKAEEEIANGMASEASIMSIDDFSRAATGGMTICLDPGHGGSDSGANAFGQKESALTLKIANYCKEELAKYDVNVVMTRTTDTRPSENAAQDLKDRVMTAKKAGASYIISIHLNSSENTSAHGAEVYFPNTSGNASLSSNGQALAKAIQSQLVALGLYDRGIKIRNYSDGSTSSNPNSSDRDYYGIIRYAKEQNISGLIIEHCFLNNPDEYNKYLSSDAKLQQLGVADAKGIVNALGLQQKYSELDTLASQNKNLIADGTYLIQSSINTKYVFDIYGGYATNGANVQLYKGNDTLAQLFKITHDSKGYVTITNAKSGRVLDVYGGTAQNEQNIWQYTSNGTRAQKWVIKKDGNSYVFVSALNPNYVLDLSGGQAKSGRNIQLYSYTGSYSQKWNLTKYVTKEERLDALASQNKNTIADGEYEICSAKNNSYGFDVYGGSTSSGANIQLYKRNGSKAQTFKIKNDSNGYVTITNVKSGKALDLYGGTVKNSQNIWQYSLNGSRAQKWIIKKNSSGYTIISALDPNYVIDLCGGTTRSGANIQLYTDNDTIAQQWQFNKVVTEQEKLDQLAAQNKNMMNDGVYYIKNRDVRFALDVSGGSAYSGANVQLYSLNKTDAQKWLVSHDSKGYVSFKNVNSGMYLTATSSGNSANVNQQSPSNGYDQKWIIAFDSNQNIKIISALHSSRVLDVYGGKISNGSNIQLYTSNNSAAQKWVLEYISKDVQVSLTKIMGTSQTSVAQMVRYYKANASGYDTFRAKYEGKYDGSLAKGGASTIEQFAQIFYEEANAEGVKAEVAFTQCMKETGFLKYGGDVLPNQYNFAGIGATGAVHGASFKDVRTGIRAQIQHLKAYASTSPLNNACVDPRFNLVTRNTAPYVEWLGIKENPNGYGWATAKNYGYDIVGMVKVLLSK